MNCTFYVLLRKYIFKNSIFLGLIKISDNGFPLTLVVSLICNFTSIQQTEDIIQLFLLHNIVFSYETVWQIIFYICSALMALNILKFIYFRFSFHFSYVSLVLKSFVCSSVPLKTLISPAKIVMCFKEANSTRVSRCLTMNYAGIKILLT